MLLLNIKNKSNIVLLLLFILMPLIVFNIQYKQAQNSKLALLDYLVEEKINTLKFEENLKKNNGENIFNYYVEDYLFYYKSLQLNDSVNQYFGSMVFLLFPIICGVVGILITYRDIKYRTNKLWQILTANMNFHDFKNILISGILLFIGLILSFVIYLILIVYSTDIKLSNTYDFIFNMDNLAYNRDGNIIKDIGKILFIYLIGMYHLIFFSYLTRLTNNNIVPLCLLFIYNLLVPPLGNYDFKALLYGGYINIFSVNSSGFRILFDDRTINYPYLITLWVLVLVFIIYLVSYLINKHSFPKYK